MAAFLGQGMALTGAQVQPEVQLLLEWIQGDSVVDLRSMPHHRAETLRQMRSEFLAHYRPNTQQGT